MTIPNVYEYFYDLQYKINNLLECSNSLQYADAQRSKAEDT